MIFDKNAIFSLWVKNSPTGLNYQCWKSWTDCGYRVELYTDDPGLFAEVPLSILQNLEIKLLPSFSSFQVSIDKENVLQFADLWRFIFLFERGGTWLDSDMMLKKRLPHDDIIISSEHTLKAGGRKSKFDRTPNIGLLRFPPHNPFIEECVRAMLPTTKQDLSSNVNNTSKMKKFIKEIRKPKWSHILESVADPQVFCPVPYPFAKELYTSNSKIDKTKYGLNFNYEDDTTIGLHLWENLLLNKYKVDLWEDANEQSLFNEWCRKKKPEAKHS